eukprot:CAMPEP_0197925328 /NCGR_PEP_ID=MMETSP1439-20131203/97222_1 /TAXON_ID=66791 /ORGANISM="Gonyaulax spinifera, Strain CCMP409" /LENGTH=152 /DNA_ID=CAMNT_0043547803 /DNA_START=35 /DNA_END=493 /DNA_ORIENTATION=+
MLLVWALWQRCAWWSAQLMSASTARPDGTARKRGGTHESSSMKGVEITSCWGFAVSSCGTEPFSAAWMSLRMSSAFFLIAARSTSFFSGTVPARPSLPSMKRLTRSASTSGGGFSASLIMALRRDVCASAPPGGSEACSAFWIISWMEALDF